MKLPYTVEYSENGHAQIYTAANGLFDAMRKARELKSLGHAVDDAGRTIATGGDLGE